MREILFRGKNKKTGNWIYGGYDTDFGLTVDKRERHWINIPYIGCLIVFPETVGQYTGLTDKNGTRIFEGDIVNVNTNKDTLCHRYEGRNLVIRFDEYHRFVASGRLEYPLCSHYEWEVIGNIHDNPELLEGGGE